MSFFWQKKISEFTTEISFVNSEIFSCPPPQRHQNFRKFAMLAPGSSKNYSNRSASNRRFMEITAAAVAKIGFDPTTSGLWAQHASSAPLRTIDADRRGLLCNTNKGNGKREKQRTGASAGVSSIAFDHLRSPSTSITFFCHGKSLTD